MRSSETSTTTMDFWKENKIEVKGYKVFNPDWTCLGKQYNCPGEFREDVDLKVCGYGMRFCKQASDCFNYYSFYPKNHVAEVIARGTVMEDGDRCCTDHLEIVREIPWAELLTIVNEGKDCTGFCNTGNWNTGNRNTGSRNTGNCNTGNCNTGDWNTGSRNTGNWNKSSFNTGCFNTEEEKIRLFNKPSSWTYRDLFNSMACYLLNQIPKNVVEWVWTDDMTDEEKAQYPTHTTTGGYLKVLDEADCAALWWGTLDDADKKTIMSIPNFDKAVFKEITGIDVEGE